MKRYSRKVETYLRTIINEWKAGKTITKYLTVSLSKLRAGETRDVSSHSHLQKKKISVLPVSLVSCMKDHDNLRKCGQSRKGCRKQDYHITRKNPENPENNELCKRGTKLNDYENLRKGVKVEKVRV